MFGAGLNRLGRARARCGRGARRWLAACAGALLAGAVMAASAACDAPRPMPAGEPLDVAGWIARMHQAASRHDYSGTFVVLSGHGAMTSARIWHVCDGEHQIERVEQLSGKHRVLFRRGGEVRTFFPNERLVISEMRDAPGPFPRVPQTGGVQPSRHYAVEVAGQDRVAGLDADVLAFVPQDALRFGYRIWVDRASGLPLKMQTLDGGQVLEQAAFSDLAFEAPAGLQQMARLMDDVEGYRLVTIPTQPTTALAEGWLMDEASQVVNGFVLQGCYKKNSYKPLKNKGYKVFQCIFSDGMATLSLFVEPAGAQPRHGGARTASVGSTRIVVRQIQGDAWVTAVGEVPAPTLRRFIEGLRRKP